VNSILILELIVGMVISFTLLGILIWAVKGGQFEDSKRMMNGLLYDTEEDLQIAVKREQKIKELKDKKANKINQE
jgi:cbb3-type cytochrome oxidase maturation protein